MGTALGVGGMEAPEVGEMVAWVVAGLAVAVGMPAGRLHMWDQQVGVTCRIRLVPACGPSGTQRWVGWWVGVCVGGAR